MAAGYGCRRMGGQGPRERLPRRTHSMEWKQCSQDFVTRKENPQHNFVWGSSEIGASPPMLSGGTAEGPVRATENVIILRLARARHRYTGLLRPGAELLGSYPRMFHAGLPSPASP